MSTAFQAPISGLMHQNTPGIPAMFVSFSYQQVFTKRFFHAMLGLGYQVRSFLSLQCWCSWERSLSSHLPPVSSPQLGLDTRPFPISSPPGSFFHAALTASTCFSLALEDVGDAPEQTRFSSSSWNVFFLRSLYGQLPLGIRGLIPELPPQWAFSGPPALRHSLWSSLGSFI